MWPNKDNKPEEKKPEEKPQLTGEELLAKMGELLAPLKTSIDNQAARLSAIEESRKPKEEPKPTEIPSVLDNEDAAFNTRLTPLALQNVLLQARIIEREVLDEVSADGWAEFLPEIKEELSNTPPQIKASQTYDKYIRNVVDMIVGRKSRASGLRRRDRGFVLEDASSAPSAEAEKATSEDREFLNFKITTSKGKVVTRRDFLKSQGIDIENPETLKQVKENWAKVQVVN